MIYDFLGTVWAAMKAHSDLIRSKIVHYPTVIVKNDLKPKANASNTAFMMSCKDEKEETKVVIKLRHSPLPNKLGLFLVCFFGREQNNVAYILLPMQPARRFQNFNSSSKVLFNGFLTH